MLQSSTRSYFLGILAGMLFIASFIITGCNDESKVDQDLPIPPVQERISYSMEQIKFWHSKMPEYKLLNEQQDMLLYQNINSPDVSLGYNFKGGESVMAIIGLKCRSQAILEDYTDYCLKSAKEQGFTINLGNDDHDNSIVQVFEHNTIPKFRCRITADFENAPPVVVSTAYYNAK